MNVNNIQTFFRKKESYEDLFKSKEIGCYESSIGLFDTENNEPAEHTDDVVVIGDYEITKPTPEDNDGRS